MTGIDVVMKVLSGVLIAALVGLPILMWGFLLVAAMRSGARNVHERVLDAAAERRHRAAARDAARQSRQREREAAIEALAAPIAWEAPSTDAVAVGDPTANDTAAAFVPPLEPTPLDDQPAAVIAAVARRVFHPTR
jgi:hypothetical protein